MEKNASENGRGDLLKIAIDKVWSNKTHSTKILDKILDFKKTGLLFLVQSV